MDISRLIEIAQEVGFEEIKNRLRVIQEKQSLVDVPISLPLVGEFSSGKTSLINALTEGKALEISTKPTTATIFEVHFCGDSNYAVVKNPDGSCRKVEDVSSLKNVDLADADFVKVYDTSKRIPATTLLIDTPGLSSNDPRHRQALVSYLPEADGILLVMDINAQLTRSTIDFINTVSLSSRPIYLILTKCDTKTKSETEATIRYIRENHKLPLQKIICTSASQSDLDEFYSMLDDIQKDKKEILGRVNAKRIRVLVDEMLSNVDTLLSATEDNKGIQEAISKQRLELQRAKKSVERFLENVGVDIDSAKREAVRSFEDKVFSNLDSLVAGKSSNFDSEAISIINNNSTLVLNVFKNDIRKIVSTSAKNAKDVSLPVQALESMDLSDMSINGISYNLNLNELGHEYDKKIATGLKIAAAAGVVVATAGAGSSVVGAAAGEEAVSLLEVADVVTDIADTVTDVGSIVNKRNGVQIVQQFVSDTQEQLNSIEQTQQGIGQQFGSDKGIVESIVGFVTDSTMGKPQRRRAIHEYMDNSLIPSFKAELERLAVDTVGKIKAAVDEGIDAGMEEMTRSLETLRLEQKDQHEAFVSRISALRDYRNELLNF